MIFVGLYSGRGGLWPSVLEPVGTSVNERHRRDISIRQNAIIELVHRQGFATIESMADAFGVSAQTIRRDVIELSRRKLLQRYHGGAGLPTGEDRLAYVNRRVRNAEEKQRIGRTVAAHVPNGASLFIDIGTTMEAVAWSLLEHKGLRVITNHMSVASIFCENTDFEIILLGGLVRNWDRATTGEATSEFLRRFRVTYALCSVGAIDGEGHLLDNDYRDVGVSRAAMEISRRRYVVADSSKFHGDALMHLAHIAEIEAVFTDAPPPDDIAGQIVSHNVKLFVASQPETGRAGVQRGGKRAV